MNGPGNYGACGCAGAGAQRSAAGPESLRGYGAVWGEMGPLSHSPLGFPGGYLQEYPPQSRMASMSQATEPILPGHDPATVVIQPRYVERGVMTAGQSPYAPAGPMATYRGYGGPYGYAPIIVGAAAAVAGIAVGAVTAAATRKKDATKQCAKAESKLAEAQAGRGFLGNLFGKSVSKLQTNANKWCAAKAVADQAYTDIMQQQPIDVQMLVDAELTKQEAADANTELYAAAGIGVATLGLVGLVLLGGGR